MTSLEQLTTPAALVDVARMQRNIDRMESRMRELGVKFRPHVKTTKCVAAADPADSQHHNASVCVRRAVNRFEATLFGPYILLS